MVVVCLVSYFVVFLFLKRRQSISTPHPGPLPDRGGEGGENPENPKSAGNETVTHTSPRPSLLPAGAERGKIFAFLAFFRGNIGNPNFWLCAFVVLVLVRYAFDYADAAKSLQVLVLLTGIVIGKGIGLWATWGKQPTTNGQHPTSKETETRHLTPSLSPGEAERVSASPSINNPLSTIHKARAVIPIIVFLLACAALYQPERGMEYFYRGQQRWTGPWDNPNLFGVLMGTGLVLAVGLLVQRLRSKVQGREAKAEGREPGQVGRGSPLPAVGGASVRASQLVRRLAPPEEIGPHGVTRPTIRYTQCFFLLIAAGLCELGLLKSYSRGAWLGTAIALAFLLFQVVKFQVSSGSVGRVVVIMRRNWFPSSILVFSILVISFWQFRHTEAPLLRRVFSAGNVNDFSWRNRVAAWEGAGRMMLARPIIGFGWGKAEEVYSKEYRAARLEESAAIQMNDYLMIGISAGTPALVCLLIYLLLTGFQVSGFKFQVRQGKTLHLGLKPSDFLPTVCFAGAIVGMVGFWFDGGLFKLPTATVFWVLLELCRRRGVEAECLTPMPTGGESVRASRLGRSLAPPIKGGVPGVTRPTVALRWLAGIFAIIAFGLTALHLGAPQLAVSERTLNFARKFLVPPNEKTDFEYLAAEKIWLGMPLKTLLQHAHLANYNRDLVNWKLEDDLYREFVLSPELNLQPATFNIQRSTNHAWRRPLWEYFYPRIRKESSLEAAAENIVRNLSEVCQRRGNETQTEKAEGRRQKAEIGKSIAEIWRQQEASDTEFARLCVATLRSVGIPARLAASGQAEFWNGAEWKPAPRPVEAMGK